MLYTGVVGWGGIGDKVEDKNEFEAFQIINVYRSISYISRPENDVVDQNPKAILVTYVYNVDILG